MKPEPTYLCIQWQRTSHTIHAVPVLRETSESSRAARFSLRSFAESAGQYSPQRVVPVDAPSWQLYTRMTGEDGTKVVSTTTTERELILRPVFPMTTLPTPTVVSSSGAGTDTSGVVGSTSASNTAAAAVGYQPWAFRARWWEGSARTEGQHDANHSNLASFSFLLEGSAAKGGPAASLPNPFQRGASAAPAAAASAEHIVALSTLGKLFVISSDHADGVAMRTSSSFVPLEAVPATSDAEIQFQLSHQTPAMRERALFRAATRALSTNFLQQGLLEPFRIILVGASGSGKSTLAHWVDRYSLHHNHQQHGTVKPNAAAGAAQQHHRGGPAAPASHSASASSGEQQQQNNTTATEDISKRIHTVNCNGIAVPLVISDVPSSASAAYIRTQCTGADIVLCVFDVSDEHSLHWLETNMAAICSDAKDELTTAAANTTTNRRTNHHHKHRQNGDDNTDAAAGGGHAAPGLPQSLPRTKFVLCATRVDSLRVAVDSYRLEAFRSATEAFTGPSSIAWLPPIETIFASGTNSSAGGLGRDHAGIVGSTSAGLATPLRYSGAGPPSLTAIGSGHSFTSSTDAARELLDAPPPFSHFGTRWRMWRLPTATRATSAPVARELQALLAEGNLSESFLFSPNLKRLAAEGAMLAPHGAEIPRSSGATTRRGAMVSDNVSFSGKDPLASTQKEEDCGVGGDAPQGDMGDDGLDDDDWKVPRQMMQCLGGVLEELYLVRIGKSLGWTEAMVSRFAVASCVATTDARQEEAEEEERQRMKEEQARMLGVDPAVKPAASAALSDLHDGSGAYRSSRIVANLFQMLHLPKTFQYDVVREVLHTPKVTRQKGGVDHHLRGGVDESSFLVSPTTTRTPQRQSSRWAGATGGSDGTTTPQQHAGGHPMDASTLLLNSSISAIGSESIRRFTASFAMPHLLSPLSLTMSKHHSMRGLRSPQLDESLQLLQSTSGDGGHATVTSLAAINAKYPLSDSRTQNALLMTTPGLPPALMPFISSTNSNNPLQRSSSLAAAPPTWKEVIACSLRQWHEHWLVFRWIAASAAAGDVRAELVMGMLRGEHDEFTFLPTAHQKRAILRDTKHVPPYTPAAAAFNSANIGGGGGGGGGVGGVPVPSTATTTTVPLVKLPYVGITEDNDAMSVTFVRSMLLRELHHLGVGDTQRGNRSGADSSSQSGGSQSAVLAASGFGENRSNSSGSDSRQHHDDDDDEREVSSVLSNETVSMSVNHRRRLWLPIAAEPAPASVVHVGGHPGGGGIPSTTQSSTAAVRVFHPTDLMYIAFGSHVPKEVPPVSIPDAALWVYQQPQQPWSDRSSSRRSGGEGGEIRGSGGSASSRFGHVSPVMLETMFWMVGIDMRRDHTSRLLRWADTNGDRLTDASDFMRWFTLLLFGLAAHDRVSGSAVHQRFTSRPTGNDNPLGGAAATAVDATADAAAASTGNSIGSPAAAAAVAVGSSYLALLSTLWALRTYHWVPMLEALSTACRSGLPRDRAWAAAASAYAFHVPPVSFGSVLSVFEGPGGGPGGNARGAFGGGAGDDDCAWEDGGGTTKSSVTAQQAEGGQHLSARRIASNVLSRMASALFGKSSSSPTRTADPSSSSSSSSSCHRCRMTFRAIFRPATECQQCHNHFCSRCCKSIIVLNDSNKTEKRKLCLTCRRTHSTFLDDFDNDDGPPPPPGITMSAAREHHHHQSQRVKENRLSSATLESMDAAGPLSSDGGRGSPSPRNHSPLLPSHTHGTSSGVVVAAAPTTTSHVVWEDDAQTSCSICAATFTVLRRRHHCRLCGALVCGSCSPHTIMLKDFVGPQRMCVSCFQGRRALEMNQERRRNFLLQQHQQQGTTMSSTTAAASSNDGTAKAAGWKKGAGALHSVHNPLAEPNQPHGDAASALMTPAVGGSTAAPSSVGGVESPTGSPASPSNSTTRRNSHTLKNVSSTTSFDDHSTTTPSSRHHHHSGLERGVTHEDRQVRKQRWHALERAAAAHKRHVTDLGEEGIEGSDDHDEWSWLHAAREMLAKDGGGDQRRPATQLANPDDRKKRPGAIVMQPWYETYSPQDEQRLIEAARAALEEQARTVEYLLSMPGGKAAIEAERGATWSYAVYQPGWFAAHDSTLEVAYSAQQLEEMGPDVGPH
jgi:hypothetical protein